MRRIGQAPPMPRAVPWARLRSARLGLRHVGLRVALALLTLGLTGGLPIGQPPRAGLAEVAHAQSPLDWTYKSFSMAPYNDSELFNAGPALQQLASVGANSVTFVPTWYTSSEYDSSIFATSATASDASMVSAIQQARSLGLQVIIKPHVDIQNGMWRAYINPTDPNQWFANYTALIDHYADMAAAQGASALCIGAELITMSTNTAYEAQWRSLIAGVRQRFGGKLTYSANWGSGSFSTEFTRIPFWDALDYLGISAYFNLASTTSPTVAQLDASWTNWQTGTILPYQRQVGKPIVFTEVGYRSAQGAAMQPWDSWDTFPFDGQGQANLYEALFESWGQNAAFAGAMFWFWSTNTNLSATDTDYPVQNKPAQSTVSDWFHAQSTAPISLLAQPTRLVDTRSAGGALQPGAARCFSIAGQAGIPADAAGVVLNVTATGQTGRGWLTLYPAGQSLPATSTLNFDPSQHALANGAVVRTGSGGQVCAQSAQASVQLILDATGFLPAASAQSLPLLPSPARVVDTRSTGGAVQPGADRCFAIAGQAGIPANATGAVLNLTAAGYTGNGWFTLYPAGSPRPATSTLNFDPYAWAIANNAVARLGSGGQLCVSASQSSAQAILDVVGYLLPGATGLTFLGEPQRVVDTRSSGGAIQPGADRCFSVAGQAGVPQNATGVLGNVTATGYTAPGWLTLYPAGQALPATSTLNFDITEAAIANGAALRLGASGQLCGDARQSSSQLILDIAAYLQ